MSSTFSSRLTVISAARAGAAAQAEAVTALGGRARVPAGRIAPEALTGQPVDRRFDVYALGIVLWELLTGRRYFDAKNEIDVLMMARSPRWQPARDLRPDVPEALDSVIRTALAARAADRFDTAAAFEAALLEAVPGAAAVGPSAIAALASRGR